MDDGWTSFIQITATRRSKGGSIRPVPDLPTKYLPVPARRRAISMDSVLGEPLCDSEGRIARWYGLITDIDDRKRAEDALRESELNSRLIVDTIPALVCTMTANGEVELVNQQVLDYWQDA